MHVAACTVNGRIAPKYYDATQLLSLIIEGETVVQQKIITVEELNPHELCSLVLHMKVDVVICGGIRKDYQQKLKGPSVQLIFNVIGKTDDVIKRFVEGNLHTGDIVN